MATETTVTNRGINPITRIGTMAGPQRSTTMLNQIDHITTKEGTRGRRRMDTTTVRTWTAVTLAAGGQHRIGRVHSRDTE